MNQSNILQPTFDICALCAKSTDLRDSHIVPRFFVKRLRETSATGHFRHSQSPNVRVQDGLKFPMLCGDCEQLFSLWEKDFSEKCFIPLDNRTAHEVRYESWMLKFATSISWRVLRVFLASGELSGFPDHIIIKINEALHEWTQYLLGDRPHPGCFEQHMFLVDLIVGTSVNNVPCNINRYLTRAIDIRVDHNQEWAITYAKMGKFILFGFIAMTHPRHWKGTKLNANHGRFGPQEIELPPEIMDFLFIRAESAAQVKPRISERQQAKITQFYRQDPDRAAKSETLRALDQDVFLFGRKAFDSDQT